MPENFRESQLSECLKSHTTATDFSIERIRTGKFNTSYFVVGNGSEWVLRIAPPPDAVFCFYEKDMMKQEPAIHRLLLEKTNVPVAPIIVFDDSHEIIDRDFLIMERLPGRPMSEAWGVSRDRVLAQVGEALAQAHAITADQYGYLGEHRPMDAQPTWREAFIVMWRKLIDDIVGVGMYSKEEARTLIKLLDQYDSVFERDDPASLLHMDVWAQNILVNNDGLSGLVDWDRALWGDPEIEFAVLDYCGISQPAFWEGYGQLRDESREARIRNIFYLLYEIQKYIVIRAGRTKDPASAKSYKIQTFQIIDQAFK